MRSKLLGVAALAMIAAPMSAQRSGGANIGVFGGFVSSNVSFSGTGTGTATTGSHSGFAVGLSIGGHFAQGVGIAAEPMYIQKGWKETDAGSTGSVKISYVEVPVLLKVGFGNGPTRLHVMAGPDVSFKISCSTSFTVSGVTGSGDCNGTDEDSGSFKSTDFGVMVGAGVNFGALGLSVRYDIGLSNINNDNTDNITAKNKALLFLASLKLGH